MSGMGGIGGGGEGSHFRCETLVIDTQLSSPQSETVELIEVGDLLQVGLEASDHGVLVVVRRDDEKAGGLASPLIGRLRECMLAGTSYAARVTYRSDALVRVRIFPVAS